MRIGLIARSDRTGLGNQTRNLARLLNPSRVMLIDSSFFNGNRQHPETYKNYRTTFIEGFPTDEQVRMWLEDLDVVITCEIFYNNRFVDIARSMGVKTINHFNWEFADYLKNPELTLPDKLVSPSKWNLDKARALWGNVEYLPTPVFVDDFAEVRETNLNRQGKRRFLHIMGRQAVNDRNGTQDLLKSLEFSNGDFELVVKMQSGAIVKTDDPRVTIDTSSPENESELYRDFDAMILPRKYAGQCLPMNEALCSGLPVVMTDISPNNTILPQFWLVSADLFGRFMARTWVDIYTVKQDQLGQRLDFLTEKNLDIDKKTAYNIGYNEYSDKILKQKWIDLIEATIHYR